MSGRIAKVTALVLDYISKGYYVRVSGLMRYLDNRLDDTDYDMVHRKTVYNILRELEDSGYVKRPEDSSKVWIEADKKVKYRPED